MTWYVEKFGIRNTLKRSPQLHKLVAEEGDWADLAIPDTSSRYGNSVTGARPHYLGAAMARHLTSFLVIDRTHDDVRGVAEIQPDVQVSMAANPRRLVMNGMAVRYWLRQSATEERHQQVGSSIVNYIGGNMSAIASRHVTGIDVEGGHVLLGDQRSPQVECNVLALVDVKSDNVPLALTEILDDRGPINQFLIQGQPPTGLAQPNMDVHLFARRLQLESTQA